MFVGTAVEQQSQSSQGLAARAHRLPFGGCSHEAAVADGLDEQLHQTRGGFFPHSVPASALAGRLSLVSGETCATQRLSTILNSNEHLRMRVGHTGGRRRCHRRHDVAEWRHVRSGSLELCHASR